MAGNTISYSLVFTILVNLASTQTTASTLYWPTQSYKSFRSTPPALYFTRNGPTSSDHIFIAPDGSSHPNSTAPLILSDNGTLIWSGPTEHAFAFSPQIYKDQPVLAYWNGTVFPEPIGRGFGTITLLNASYEIVANTTLPGNFVTLNASQTFQSNIDLHEIAITSYGSLLVTANNVTQFDLSSIGGPSDGWVVDAQAYEIDIATNKILFSWKSLDHLDTIPMSLSVLPLGNDGYGGANQSTAYNYFHINAFNLLPSKDEYLISSRYLCSAISVSKNGTINWRLAGIAGDGDFTQVGGSSSFCFQHDVRPLSGNTSQLMISMHDNANSPLTLPNPTTPTSGLFLKVDLHSKTVSPVRRFQDPKFPIYSTAQGSCRILSDGHIFMVHGFTPMIEEYHSNGTSIMTAQFGPVTDGLGERQDGFGKGNQKLD